MQKQLRVTPNTYSKTPIFLSTQPQIFSVDQVSLYHGASTSWAEAAETIPENNSNEEWFLGLILSPSWIKYLAAAEMRALIMRCAYEIRITAGYMKV